MATMSRKNIHNITVLSLLMLLAGTSVWGFNYQLIRDYLLYTNVQTVLLVTDESETTFKIKESRNLQADGIWMNHWTGSDSRDFDFDHFFLRSSQQICVVINLASNRTPIILHEISQRNMFHFERSWLMFDTNNQQMFSVLSAENVNVDAQISNAVQINEK